MEENMGKDLFNDRISRFSIRKLNVGVCSVLLGTLVMVGTASSVAAEENAENPTTVATTTEEAVQPATTTEATTTTSEASTSATTYNAEAPVTAAGATPVTTTEPTTVATTEDKAAVATPAATEASTKPSNKATEAAATDKKEEVAAGVEAPATETPAVTAETSGGKRRTRRAIGDPNDESLIGDDVEDATSTPKVEKPGFTTDLDAKSMTSQITWLDFGDVANWTGAKTVLVPKNDAFPDKNLEEKLALQVGATYTKEIMPGYVVTVKVKSLKPFQATEIYKKRMEEQGATEAEKATYDPNAKNGYVKGV